MSALVISTTTATAIEVQLEPPYSASVSLNDNSEDTTNSFGGVAYDSTKAPYSNSRARAQNYILNAESRVSVYEPKPKPPVELLDDSPSQYLYTSASASFTQRFVVNSAGQAVLRFAWDGNLYSDGNYGAGYYYNANVNSKDKFLSSTGFGSHYDNGSTSGGSTSVDSFKIFTLNFGAKDIGKTFNVSARLNTWAGNGGENDSAFDHVSNGFNGTPQAGYAYADFFNTATFGITSGAGSVISAAAPVPVPAAVWLFGSALMGLVGLRRKKTTA